MLEKLGLNKNRFHKSCSIQNNNESLVKENKTLNMNMIGSYNMFDLSKILMIN